MKSHRKIVLFAAGLAIFLTSVVCGYGAPASNLPAPTADLSQPSGGGEAPAATEASYPTELALAPIPEETQAAEPGVPLVLAPTATAAAAEPTAMAPAPAIPEARRVTLEFPASIKVGDSDIVRLTLEIDALGGITPTAETQGNVVTGQTIQIPNVYDSHHVIAEARLDLAGVDIRPGDMISEPLLPGEPVTFYWSVHPASAGTYRGTAWLLLRFIDKASGEESRKAVSAQPVTISAGELLGLNGNLARTAGGVGSILGAVLGFPFVDEVLKWLWKRLRHAA